MFDDKRNTVRGCALAGFSRYRGLIWQLTKREVVGRYRGSFMGLLWSLLHPLVMLVVYTFMFSVVFETRWDAGLSSKFEFAIMVFAGMIVHSLFAECLNRAPVLIIHNVSYVKKVVFPLEILPCVSLGSALFHASVSIGVLLVFFVFSHGFLNWTAVFLPLLLLPLAVLCLGFSWFLASLGVFFRDVGHATGVVSMILLFLSPVFYPVSAVPESFRFLVNLNPLTFIIEQVRNVLVWGKLPNWGALVAYCVVSAVIAWLGFVWFQKTRKGFADVL